MLNTTINIILFVCVFITYVLIAQAIAMAPSMILGFFKGIIDQFRKPFDKAKELKYLTIFEFCNGIIILVCCLFLHFKYELWNSSFIYVWSNPLILFLMYFRSVVGAGLTKSENPMLRRLSAWVWFSIFPILILMVIGLTVPSIMALWMLKWSIPLSITFVLLATVFQSKSTIIGLEKFENLGKRQKEIREKIDELLHIVNVIGDTGESKELLSSVNELDKSYLTAHELLRRGEFLEAENRILQSEIEVNHIGNNLTNRIGYTLKDEIRSKLERSIVEVQELQNEFKLAAISTKQLKVLESDFKKNLSGLEAKQFTAENIIEYLSPIESLINSISTIRISLSLRKNVGEQLDKIQSEIEENSFIINIASQLGLETQSSINGINRIFVLLDMIRNKELSGAEELLEIYRELQILLLGFRESAAVFESTIYRRWNYEEIIPQKLYTFIPKYCTTDSPSEGAVILKKFNNNVEPINIFLDGVLVEFETDQTITIDPTGASENFISSFSFVGKRAGKGKIIFRLQGIADKVTVFVKIIPRTIELARESLFFAIPLGGIALLVLWGLGRNVKDYAAITGAVGGVFGLLLFFVRYIKMSKYRI